MGSTSDTMQAGSVANRYDMIIALKLNKDCINSIVFSLTFINKYDIYTNILYNTWQIHVKVK